MPSTVVQMDVATQTLVTEKLISKCKPSAIVVDNVAALLDADLIFNDVFTPSATSGVPAPVLTTRPRLRINVALGTCVSTMEELLKDIEFLGLVQVVVNAGVALPNCFVTFIYSLN
jgi:uncharacterized protein related to proFAR isomerase